MKGGCTLPITSADVSMSTMLTDLGSVATAIWTQVGEVAETITDTPLLLFTVGFLFVGGAVGIVGRLLSRG